MEPILPEPNQISSPEQERFEHQAPGAVNSARQEERPATGAESRPELLSQPPIAPITPPAQALYSDPQQVALVSDPAQVADDSAQTNSPLIADDVDVIEKEWVDKAKQIVNQTKSDPHLQEKEVGKLQADYLAKRYNKTIKRTG